MSKRNATLDASFWISASRASIIGFLFSTPAFVVWLYRDQRLNYDQARLALGRLQAEKKLRRAALVALYQMARARGDV